MSLGIPNTPADPSTVGSLNIASQPVRKVVAIEGVGFMDMVALCDDGTLWSMEYGACGPLWRQMPGPPGTENAK